jgi:hypothetical protein
MAARKAINPQLFVGIIVVVVVILGYFLWTRTVTPEPTVAADQDIKHPFGNGNPGSTGRANGAGLPSGARAPGTVDPVRGFGPSAGAAAHMKQ